MCDVKRLINCPFVIIALIGAHFGQTVTYKSTITRRPWYSLLHTNCLELTISWARFLRFRADSGIELNKVNARRPHVSHFKIRLGKVFSFPQTNKYHLF